MQPAKAPEDISDEDYVAFSLRQCALQLDPRYARFAVLADELELHESTLNTWIRNGRIPAKACRRLLSRFGKKLIDFNRLVGENGHE